MKKKNNIVVFEHEKIKLNQVINGCIFDEFKLSALQKFYGNVGVPYYSLIYNGIQFNNYVGVLQVGNLVIEVLPKADRNSPINKETEWRNMLIDMMRVVNNFDVKATSQSHLKIKPNSILDLYIEMFINEVEYLIHTGLIKQYRKKTGNVSALKGNLLFSKHIQENLIHQERFYVRHSVYDVEHLLHIILYKAILLIKGINVNLSLISRINALLLLFPEMPNEKITETTFAKIFFNRKSESYRKAIGIAKFLILQYHPDLSLGNNHVLALMFDMNVLWEQFVYVSLRKYLKHELKDISVKNQVSRNFWQQEKGSLTKIRPDIVIGVDDNKYVLDTKWKCLNGYNPSTEDLRQMYVYHEYFKAEKVALVYPNSDYSSSKIIKGKYSQKSHQQNEIEMECSIMPLNVENENIKAWQKSISRNLLEWIKIL